MRTANNRAPGIVCISAEPEKTTHQAEKALLFIMHSLFSAIETPVSPSKKTFEEHPRYRDKEMQNAAAPLIRDVTL